MRKSLLHHSPSFSKWGLKGDKLTGQWIWHKLFCQVSNPLAALFVARVFYRWLMETVTNSTSVQLTANTQMSLYTLPKLCRVLTYFENYNCTALIIFSFVFYWVFQFSLHSICICIHRLFCFLLFLYYYFHPSPILCINEKKEKGFLII